LFTASACEQKVNKREQACKQRRFRAFEFLFFALKKLFAAVLWTSFEFVFAKFFPRSSLKQKTILFGWL